MSLRDHIIFHAQQRPQFINGGEFEDLARTLNFKSSNASRRLRELENEGILEVRYNEKGCVEYKYKRIMERVKVEVESEVKVGAMF